MALIWLDATFYTVRLSDVSVTGSFMATVSLFAFF